MFRTDLNLNPTAFTIEVAREAKLTIGVDYVIGTQFISGKETYYTAKLILDPVGITIKVIDRLGFYVHNLGSTPRWTYISMPWKLWISLTYKQKSYVIGQMYIIEGGTEMKSLFPAEI